ncbi:hypothetical protein ACTXG7_02315 [Mycolicibacterium sp. Dal123E01]|uniref:PIN-like domain-containing protein n=1 Tax=Mycolicibacterium sp. Dal123E01 TaxID=3457578 RepID=UPI00403E6BDF
MKFFLDENVNHGCLEPLRTIYREHEFNHAFDEGLSGTDDIPLFKTLHDQRYEAIITKDRQQLVVDAERRALFDARLHWIGHKAKDHDGLLGISIETATVTAGLIFVIRDWRSDPHIYRMTGVEAEPTQRIKITAVEQAKWNLPDTGKRGLSLA